MRPTYQVVYLPEAEAALEKTATYITEHDGPQRAASWLLRMIESIDKLETMPSLFAERGVRDGRKHFETLGVDYAVVTALSEVKM